MCVYILRALICGPSAMYLSPKIEDTNIPIASGDYEAQHKPTVSLHHMRAITLIRFDIIKANILE